MLPGTMLQCERTEEPKLRDHQLPTRASQDLLAGVIVAFERAFAGFPQHQGMIQSQTPHEPEGSLGNDSSSLGDSYIERPGEKSSHTPI